MLKIPTLPLDAPTLEFARFCYLFKEEEGFFQVYEQKLAELLPARKQYGLKTQAYEQAEALYQQYFGHRCFADITKFWHNYSERNTKLHKPPKIGIKSS